MTTPRADIGAEAVKDGGGIPEELLAAAVLHMALEDLLEPQRLCIAGDDPLANRQESRELCFSSKPESRQAREFWCELAGVEVSFFEKQARERELSAATLR